MAKAGRMTKLTMGAAAALLGATATGPAASANPGAPWHHRFHPHAVAGTVSAVNGSSAPGACGTADSAGAFTVAAKHDVSDTVDVSTTTRYFERHVTDPSFATVCVGDLVGAIGTLSGTTLDANDVSVTPPPPRVVFGTVSAVNGSSATGACGTADSAGTFTVMKHQKSDTVDVGTSTAFFSRGATSPSFTAVCVGDLVGAIGTLSGTILDAHAVFVAVPPTPGPATSSPAATTNASSGPVKVTSAHPDSTWAPHASPWRPDNDAGNGSGRDPGWGSSAGGGDRGRGSSGPGSWSGPPSVHGRR